MTGLYFFVFEKVQPVSTRQLSLAGKTSYLKYNIMTTPKTAKQVTKVAYMKYDGQGFIFVILCFDKKFCFSAGDSLTWRKIIVLK